MLKRTSLFFIFCLLHSLIARPVVDEVGISKLNYHILHTAVPPRFAGYEPISKTPLLEEIETFYELSPKETLFVEEIYPDQSHHYFLASNGLVLPYNNALASIFSTLKSKPFLLSSSHKALLFHGSTSASLIAFTESAGADRGKLLPTGVLLQKDKAPFSGALDFGCSSSGINRRAISTVFIDNIDDAIYYAQLKHQDLLNDVGFDWHKEIAEKQHSTYSHLNNLEKELIGLQFPVVYGFRIDLGHTCKGVESEICHEIGILNEVDAHEIRVIYVPDNYIATVKTILEEGHFSHIEVSSLDALTSIDAPIPSPWNWH